MRLSSARIRRLYDTACAVGGRGRDTSARGRTLSILLTRVATGRGRICHTNWQSGGRQVDYSRICMTWVWEEVAGGVLLSDLSGSPLHHMAHIEIDILMSKPWSGCLGDGSNTASYRWSATEVLAFTVAQACALVSLPGGV